MGYSYLVVHETGILSWLSAIVSYTKNPSSRSTNLAAVLVGKVEGVARELNTTSRLPLDEVGVLVACNTRQTKIPVSISVASSVEKSSVLRACASLTYGQSPKQDQRKPF